MLFTQLHFWYLFVAVLGLLVFNERYWRSNSVQSWVLLIASYVFYGAWDPRFLALIVLVSGQTWLCANQILRDRQAPAARYWLALSIAINIAVLGYFKYANFFLEAAGLIGGPQFQPLSIILPVGISFYIFQTLTFVIDAKTGEITERPSVLHYFTYVAFFPQLVAGPIERARHLLPQFRGISRITWPELHTGLQLIVFGLFLKVVIADQIAPVTDEIFNNYFAYGGGTLLMGMGLFSAQIYGDFCGYSTIAIGVARCMGFDLMLNFDRPYFATSLRDHWRRWHISLSSFFRDYFYIPLGGSKGHELQIALLTVATFAVSGLWHGAAWGFVIWGTLHGVIVAFERLWRLGCKRVLGYVPARPGFLFMPLGWTWTVFWIAMSWAFFRLPTLGDSMAYLTGIFGNFGLPQEFRSTILLVIAAALIDLLWWRDPKLRSGTTVRNPWMEDVLVGLMLAIVISKSIFAPAAQPFIYFQF